MIARVGGRDLPTLSPPQCSEAPKTLNLRRAVPKKTLAQHRAAETNMTGSPIAPQILVLIAEASVRDAASDALRRSGHCVMTQWPTADDMPPSLIVAEPGQLHTAALCNTGTPTTVVIVQSSEAEAPPPAGLVADYLRLPLSPAELVCRVRAQLELVSLRRSLA